MSFTLYDYVLSGNCYKVRLLASLLGVEYQSTAIDFHPGLEHESAAMLQLNPAGTLPVLVAGETVLTETAAMLVWLAQRFDAGRSWWPTHDDAQITAIMQWLGIASRLSMTVGELRLHTMLLKPVDAEAALAGALAVLRELESGLTEQQLRGHNWLAGEQPTIADIACFPYTALSPDAGIEHDNYPALRRWQHAVRSLEGFVTMPGIFELHENRSPDGGAAKESVVATGSSCAGEKQ